MAACVVQGYVVENAPDYMCAWCVTLRESLAFVHLLVYELYRHLYTCYNKC